MKKILHLIDCEIDCIESGNALTPSQQDIAIKTCENIKQRIRGEFQIKGEIEQKISSILWILKDIVDVIDEKKSWGFDMSEESKAKIKEFLVNPDIFVNKNL